MAGVLRRFVAARRTLAPGAGGGGIAAEYLYIPCVRGGDHGGSAGTRCWVQPVPIVKKTARLIYYTSDSWDRRQAVVSPGAISYEQFDSDRPGPAGGLFFATRQAAEDYLGRAEPKRAGAAAPSAPPPEPPAAPAAPSIRQLRRAMVDAHPDRG
ncbi:MAG TPA: hypothetical protein VE864_09040, partial [Streptosporangiaceae bacterium]|nr:hypothetical protein [Streptosporangiaceae bacterium]